MIYCFGDAKKRMTSGLSGFLASALESSAKDQQLRTPQGGGRYNARL